MIEVIIRPGAERTESPATATGTGQIEDIVIASVGGQGAILATRILASLFLGQGWEVKTSEVHGMAQRGGSVESHVRRGRTVHSPLVPRGEANLLLALEQLEALRFLPWLRSGGTCVCSTERIAPVTVTQGNQAYPEGVREILAEKAGTLLWVDAPALARGAGNLRAANVALLGALSPLLEATEQEWQQAITAHLPERVRAVNLAAFRLARELSLARLHAGTRPA
ncbi:MAG: indolepyruvate oxidoreductase subunit beta [Bacillota bacterium]|nr:indolepyruvate oxidoreductase subunit beta [Bacillota bacterium]